MTYREAINLGEKVLNMADVADAKIDAWLLLEMVCKIDRSFYYLHMAVSYTHLTLPTILRV